MSFISAGHFPPRLAHRQSDLRNPEELASFCHEIEQTMGFQQAPSPSEGEWGIVWKEILSPPKSVVLDYEDFDCQRTQRTIVVTCRGERAGGARYWGAYDGDQFKTFREDRIVNFQVFASPHSEHRSSDRNNQVSIFRKILEYFCG